MGNRVTNGTTRHNLRVTTMGATDYIAINAEYLASTGKGSAEKNNEERRYTPIYISFRWRRFWN